MPNLLKSCDKFFETNNLYEVLGITKDASETEIKRAYHKLSLRVHPDKVKGKEQKQATEKFQILCKVYHFLSDKEKKTVYDETGEVESEDDDFFKDRDWAEYWRLLFAKISVEDIKAFENKYKGSDDELNDLKQAYIDCDGDMGEIINSIMCATIEDESRFREILQDQISNNHLQAKKKFVNETQENKKSRQKKAAKEAKEAEELAEELGITKREGGLIALIQSNKAAREKAADKFFDDLEAKYSKPKKQKLQTVDSTKVKSTRSHKKKS